MKALLFAFATVCSLLTTALFADDSQMPAKSSEQLNLGTKAREMLDDFINAQSVGITFDAGKANLSDTAKSQIDALASSLDKDIRGGDIILAAWADKPFPAEKGSQLSIKDRELAEIRLTVITQYVERAKIPGKIIKYNMAETSNAFARFFNTDATKVKQAFRKASSKDQSAAEIARVLRDKGGESKGVIYFRALVYPAH